VSKKTVFSSYGLEKHTISSSITAFPVKFQVTYFTDAAILQGTESFFERAVVAQLLMKLPDTY
jgi:hypothetical protein